MARRRTVSLEEVILRFILSGFEVTRDFMNKMSAASAEKPDLIREVGGEAGYIIVKLNPARLDEAMNWIRKLAQEERIEILIQS